MTSEGQHAGQQPAEATSGGQAEPFGDDGFPPDSDDKGRAAPSTGFPTSYAPPPQATPNGGSPFVVPTVFGQPGAAQQPNSGRPFPDPPANRYGVPTADSSGGPAAGGPDAGRSDAFGPAAFGPVQPGQAQAPDPADRTTPPPFAPPSTGSARVPARGEGSGLPQRGDGTGLPQRGDGAGFPQLGNSTGLPQRGDSTGLPQRGDSTGLPQRGDSTGLSQRGDGAGLPQRGGLPQRAQAAADGPPPSAWAPQPPAAASPSAEPHPYRAGEPSGGFTGFAPGSPTRARAAFDDDSASPFGRAGSLADHSNSGQAHSGHSNSGQAHSGQPGAGLPGSEQPSSGTPYGRPSTSEQSGASDMFTRPSAATPPGQPVAPLGRPGSLPERPASGVPGDRPPGVSAFGDQRVRVPGASLTGLPDAPTSGLGGQPDETPDALPSRMRTAAPDPSGGNPLPRRGSAPTYGQPAEPQYGRPPTGESVFGRPTPSGEHPYARPANDGSPFAPGGPISGGPSADSDSGGFRAPGPVYGSAQDDQNAPSYGSAHDSPIFAADQGAGRPAFGDDRGSASPAPFGSSGTGGPGSGAPGASGLGASGPGASGPGAPGPGAPGSGPPSGGLFGGFVPRGSTPSDPEPPPFGGQADRPEFGSNGSRPEFGTDRPGFGGPADRQGFGDDNGRPAFGDDNSRPAFGDDNSRPTYGSPADQPAFGSTPSQPAYGSAADRPAFGGTPDQPTYGSAPEQPSFGGGPDRPAFGSAPEQAPFGPHSDQPAFGGAPDQPAFGGAPDQPAFGGGPDRPAYGSAPDQAPFGSHSDQPAFGSTPDQPAFGSAPEQPSFGGSSNGGGPDRPAFGSTPDRSPFEPDPKNGGNSDNGLGSPSGGYAQRVPGASFAASGMPAGSEPRNGSVPQPRDPAEPPATGTARASASASVPTASRVAPVDPDEVPPPVAAPQARVYGRPAQPTEPDDDDRPEQGDAAHPSSGNANPGRIAGRASASARVAPPTGEPSMGTQAGPPFSEPTADVSGRARPAEPEVRPGMPLPPDHYGENTTDISRRGMDPSGVDPNYVPAPAVSSMHARPPLEHGFPPPPDADQGFDRPDRPRMGGVFPGPQSGPVVAPPPAPDQTSSWPGVQAQAPEEREQGRFEQFRPDAEIPPPAKPDTPHVRMLPILISVIVGAALLVGLAIGIVWLISRGSDSGGGISVAAGECVKRNGDEAIKAACGDAGVFQVVSIADTKEQCADPAQPYVLNPTTDGKTQVLCLKPSS